MQYCFAGFKTDLNPESHNAILISTFDTLVPTLSAMNLVFYHGKPVDFLLSHLPGGIIDKKVMGWHNLRRADVLYVSYPNDVFVAIYVNKFQFMNPNRAGNNPPNLNWDINLLRKEEISYPVVFNGVQCINGCQYRYR